MTPADPLRPRARWTPPHAAVLGLRPWDLDRLTPGELAAADDFLRTVGTG